MDNRKFLPFIITGIILIFVIIFLSSSIFLTIDAGDRGVLFKRFSGGLDMETIYTSCFWVIAPWNTMYVYDVKERNTDETMDVLDKSGLSIKVDVSLRFQPVYNKIGYLHEYFGKDYINQLIIPEMRSTVRRVMGRFTAEEIYSTKRTE